MGLMASAMMVSSPVFASGGLGEYNLLKEIESYGIRVRFNAPICDKEKFQGSYDFVNGQLHVCQDNVRGKEKSQGQVVEMTPNDLDTIRHEAVHVIHDCMDGRLGNRKLYPIFQTDEARVDFVTRVLPQEKIKQIITFYLERGLEPIQVEMELEAFAIAASAPAAAIEETMGKACSLNFD